ncbi:unannotated protein [freshwater metagenome]|uniref:Unannotated protein n=1 Tax=freshwater metagenome TaxID=449393 RepID=A0A6J7G2F9_9ZZZZ
MWNVSTKPEATSCRGHGHSGHDESDRPDRVPCGSRFRLGKLVRRHNVKTVFSENVTEAGGTEAGTVDGDRGEGGQRLFEAGLKSVQKRRDVGVAESALSPERSQRDVTDSTVQRGEQILVRRTQIRKDDDRHGKANLNVCGGSPQQGKATVDAMHAGMMSRVVRASREASTP